MKQTMLALAVSASLLFGGLPASAAVGFDLDLVRKPAQFMVRVTWGVYELVIKPPVDVVRKSFAATCTVLGCDPNTPMWGATEQQ